MIGKRQLALLQHARAALKLSDEDFAATLRLAGCERIEDLTKSTFDKVMDQATVLGYRDERRPVLSESTLARVCSMYAQLKMTEFQIATLLRGRGGVGKLENLDGNGLLSMLVYFEANGGDLIWFIRCRRNITEKQITLMHVARSQTEVDEPTYSDFLQRYGGVNTSSDLDQRGFALMMAFFRSQGFKDRPAVPTHDRSYGERPGFASPAQLGLIRNLWAEWSDGPDEAGLVTWLERSYRVSALRFLKSATASKAITALKAMKRRKSEPSKVTA